MDRGHLNHNKSNPNFLTLSLTQMYHHVSIYASLACISPDRRNHEYELFLKPILRQGSSRLCCLASYAPLATQKPKAQKSARNRISIFSHRNILVLGFQKIVDNRFVKLYLTPHLNRSGFFALPRSGENAEKKLGEIFGGNRLTGLISWEDVLAQCVIRCFAIELKQVQMGWLAFAQCRFLPIRIGGGLINRNRFQTSSQVC